MIRKFINKHVNWIAAGIYALSLVALLLLIRFDLDRIRKSSQPWEGFQKPDDVEVARRMLGEKYAGQGYFHADPGTEEMPYPYVSVFDAKGQIAGIARHRRISPQDIEKIDKLVTLLSEPPSSRIHGESRVNTLQLNLAIDQMR